MKKSSESDKQRKHAIAIVGMSCIFPGAPSLKSFWQNIINSVDSIREAGPDEWDANHYKRKNADFFGRIYCTRGGFISEFADFDPLEFGIMPAGLKGSDPDQFLALRAAAEALQDAGYNHKTFDGSKADMILGRTAAPGIGSMNLIQHGQTVEQVLNVLKAISPQLSKKDLDKIEAGLHESLQQCNADTIPAVMPNIISGRIAAKLGFRGRNLILDAACASSLIAVEIAVQGLLNGQSDIAIAGGLHINSSPYFYQMFCGLGALSNDGTIRPFDDQADGTILGEGVGMVVLKRLEDAERDGNRIYAILTGIGCSSDGRTGSSLAPNVEGEALAMRRAYEMAGVSPRTVELLEAHGTGTRAGDLAEIKAIEKVFAGEENVDAPWCAIGSVKSMIGHTQAASGMAGLIKTALALYFKKLPPTLNVTTANTQIAWSKSPCYINSTAKEWDHHAGKSPRRAAVSAFGFGGVNAHAVLEEYKATAPENNELADPIPNKRSIRLSLRYPELSVGELKIETPKVPAYLKPIAKTEYSQNDKCNEQPAQAETQMGSSQKLINQSESLSRNLEAGRMPALPGSNRAPKSGALDEVRNRQDAGAPGIEPNSMSGAPSTSNDSALSRSTDGVLGPPASRRHNNESLSEAMGGRDVRAPYEDAPITRANRAPYADESISRANRAPYADEPISRSNRAPYADEPISRANRAPYADEPISR
ncbi:MAG: polyketide synthase, partial [Candidatus Obscuribacterales bacterium]|nr:polyketide synthase [Candidatus Obscuribacterales bacterium]